MRKVVLVLAVVPILVAALTSPAFGTFSHFCCDYDNSCPGYWSPNHAVEDEVGGCTNTGNNTVDGTCTIGNKVRSCDDDSCFTWVGHVDCFGGACAVSGTLLCSGSSHILQHFQATCLSGSHGNPKATALLSSATCIDDNGYGTTHTCACSATGTAANCN